MKRIMDKFIIDEEIQKHILPPLHPDELPKLEANILSDGEVREPLVVWNGILLDGHNRWAVIQKHPELPYKVKEIDLPDRWAAIRWIQNNQLGRRNLTEAEKKLIVGNMYRAEQKALGASDGFRGNQYTSSQVNGPKHDRARYE